MLNTRQIRQNHDFLSRDLIKYKRKANCCNVGADETRLKIFQLLKKFGSLCGADLAKSLNVTASAVSHQLELLEGAGFVLSQKKGRTVHYSLNVKNKNRQINCLLNL